MVGEEARRERQGREVVSVGLMVDKKDEIDGGRKRNSEEEDEG